MGVATFDGYFLSLNPACEKVVGWGEAEVKAMSTYALRHGPRARQALAMFEAEDFDVVSDIVMPGGACRSSW